MAEYPAQLKKGGQSAGLEATGELAEMLARVLLLYAKVLFFKANARTAAFDYANAVGHGCLISAGCHILPAMLLRKASRSPTGFIEPCRPSKATRPPSGPQWVQEMKHDGFRLWCG
jgi:hypothetical protein